MNELQIRDYQDSDEASLLSAWNVSLPYDTIDQRIFHRKVLLDPNFDPNWLLIADVNGELAGFCLCLIRRAPMDKVGLEPDRGWITAMGVHPEWRRRGIATVLLNRAIQLFRESSRTDIQVATYTPHYFVPGIDVERYAEGIALFERHGFEVVSRPISMDANIVLFDYSPYLERESHLRASGIEVRALQANEVVTIIEFLKAHMPGDWVRHARDVLIDITKGIGDIEQFTVAIQGGELLGYCQFEGEHFGPFGVRSDVQGMGIGTIVMAKCLLAMRRKGLHHAWVVWTSDEAAERVYSRFGFRITRRFAVMRKMLNGEGDRVMTGRAVFNEGNGTAAMGKVFERVRLHNVSDPACAMELEAMVDTGATMMVLPHSVVEQLGLSKVRDVRVRYANYTREQKSIYGVVAIEIQGRVGNFDVIAEVEGTRPMIGQIVLEELDLVVDPRARRLTPNPESPDMPLLDIL